MADKIITVTNNIRVLVDPFNYILQTRRKYGSDSKTPGEHYWHTEGYYYNITSSLSAISDLKFRANLKGETSIEDAIGLIVKCNKETRNILENALEVNRAS